MSENQNFDVIVSESNGERKRAYTLLERILLPVALIIAILFDRLMAAPITGSGEITKTCAGVFWLCWIVIFYAVYWKKLYRNKALWFVAGCSVGLCIWNFIFKADNREYGMLTYVVIPATLMAHVQTAAGGYALKDAGRVVTAWISGWFIKPFSGIPALAGAIGSLAADDSKTRTKQACVGVLVTLLLFSILIPLLSGADQVFGYYLRQYTGGVDLSSLIFHTFIVIIAFALFYSFLWNIGFGKNEAVGMLTALHIDGVVCGIVLGTVTLLYILFCGVQFKYLFAGAGLPEGMTYSAYAREGFAQTVAVCAINLMIFGVFLRFGARNRLLTGLLGGLLGLTAFMLVSGFVRLNLYVDAYGLTWLRLLSSWFIVYLAAVVLLCAVRLLKEELPVFAVCALLLLGWYTVLGYANPDRMVVRYNDKYNYEVSGDVKGLNCLADS